MVDTKKRFKLTIVKLLLISASLGFLGSSANSFVMSQNKDKMPVWVFTDDMVTNVQMRILSGDVDHSLLTKDSKYIVLADIFPVIEISSMQIGLVGMASLGDGLLWFGKTLNIAAWLWLFIIPLKWVGRTYKCLVEFSRN